MVEKNRGGRPRLDEPLSEMVPVRFSKRELDALDVELAGMGLPRSTGVRALVLMVLAGKVPVRDGKARRDERAEGGESRVGPVVPQTVFRPLPPGMEPDPEMAE